MITNCSAKITCYAGYSKAEVAFRALPLDAVALIFSQFSVKELQDLRLVNKHWDCLTFKYIQYWSPILVKQLVQFLSDNLEDDALKASLQEVFNELEAKQESLLEMSDS